ncbi:MAG: EAL domain-containing protein [Nitrosomonadales bacterium]|nr:EAL domain-containing protein [Nitrosomonadales bacterium]
MSSPLHTKRIAWLVILLTMMATALYWWQLTRAADQLRSETIAQAELRARQLNSAVAEQVAILVRYADFAAQELADTYAQGKRREFFLQADKVKQRFPEGSLLQIGVIDAEGYLAYSNLGMKERVYLGDREHFKSHLGGGEPHLFISAPVLGRVSRQWSIQFSRPIQRNGRFAGVIVISLSPGYLHRTLATLSLAEEDSISIVRQSGEYLARNRGMEKALGTSVTSTRSYLGPDAQPSGSFRSTAKFDKVVRIYQWQRISEAPVVVVLGLSEHTLLKPVEEILAKDRLQAVIGTVVLWLLAVGAVVLLFRLSVQQGLIIERAEQLRVAGEKLRVSEKRLRTIFETEPECILVVDGKQNLLELNAAGMAILEAASMEEVHRKSFLDYIEPEHREPFVALHRQVMNGDSGILAFKTKGLRGTSRILEIHATPMLDANMEMVLLGIARDITESMHAEQQLRIAATAFESQEGMMVTNAAGVILRVNQAFTRITGYAPDEVIGKSPRILKSGRHDAQFYAAMWQSIERTGGWEGEVWNRRKSGEAYPEHLTITTVKDSEGRIANYVATLMDITASKSAEEEIRNLAFFDPLTRLPNRRLLQDRLQQALASSSRSGKGGAILFIDLDNFKTLNDTLGHDIGDLLLERVAERLVTCVREGDTVARLGGDEFVVMLEDLSENMLEAAEQAETVGNKILASLDQPYQLGSHAYNSTPSIGATLFNRDISIDELLKQADIAMYQAKKAGRNTLRFFDPRMQDSINAHAALEVELRDAIERKQFRLYFQLQIEGSSRVVGAEALIRWENPVRGLVLPAEFIPLAEETGLILTIGQWVLETACAQLKQWEKEESTRGLVLSVNVSAKQFRQTGFVGQVRNAVQRHAIDPKLLKLELTESMLLENVEDTIATMNALNEIGVGISLDDFGTGYSSLQYLKRLPLDQLKIDQSFVRDLANDRSDKTIVSTIIAMAQSLNLDVIAEGVETEAQRTFLENAGCIHYQGYLFSKPVSIEQFRALLERA